MAGKPEEFKLTKGMIKIITEVAVEKAHEIYRQEREQEGAENRDKRLYNTRLLLEKYRGLVKYSEDAVYKACQVNEDKELTELIKLMGSTRDDYTLTVDSIRERVGHTRVILQHINKMLEFYQWKCESSGKLENQNKWETIYYLYLADEEKTVAELAVMFGVDERSVYRYIKTALQDLSALFFGCLE